MNVVVGCFVDPLSNNVTYSGVKRDKWWNPLRFMVVDCRLFKGEVDTFNANCVLIPRCLVDVVGNIDDSYTHGIGDYDYGLRVHKAGGHIYMTDSPIGTCSRNKEGDELWHKGGMTLRQRFSCINTPKGVPYKERYIYYRRHAGIFWFLFFVVPYIKIIISHYKNKLI